jgi:D-aminoacyl-tRNA deacylase
MGNVGITLSITDPAGANLLERFKEIGFKEASQENILCLDNIFLIVVKPLIVPEQRYKVPKEPDPYPIDYDKLAQMLGLDYIIVASRHSARSGQPSLTVHPTGNYGKAVFGGRPRELQFTAANPMRDVFLELVVDPPRGFVVSVEATHHSPTYFDTPLFFAELGSSERQWKDEDSARYLAAAIVKGTKRKGSAPVAIGFGGGHYCPTFTVMERETSFGHIAAKHSVDLLSDDLINQMVERTVEPVEKAYLDKGLKGYQRKKIEVSLRKIGLNYEIK